jgi:hypothetical protein
MQFCIVLIPLILHFYTVASAEIAHPDHADAYFVYTWSFQIEMFCIFYLLPTFIGMGILVALEWLIMRSILRKRKTDEKLST